MQDIIASLGISEVIDSKAIISWALVFVPKVLFSIATLFIGMWAVKKINAIITKALDAANVGPEISGFLGSILNLLAKFIVILVAASIIGFKASSLLGILAAAAFAVGMALQGFLGNFASGIMIVFNKPYKVGDWVEIDEKFGRVAEVEIFSTTIVSPGQKTLIIPNGKVTDSVITNFSTEGQIRLKLEVSMPYQESFPRVEKIIKDALTQSKTILQDRPPEIGILTYDSHYIVLTVRPFIKPNNFWDATFECNALIKKAFHEHGVKAAYSEGVELGPIGA